LKPRFYNDEARDGASNLSFQPPRMPPARPSKLRLYDQLL
jgi:hypothetical protein